MTDIAASHIPSTSITEHTRLLIATHTAMRADAKRLIGAAHRLADGSGDRRSV